MWQIGVDVGGTFTDIFAYHRDSGRFVSHKTPSTPNDPSIAIATALEVLNKRFGVDTASIDRFCHGTTVATNALIQQTGGRIALITTKGFRDLLTIGRQVRPHIYDLQADYPEPLIPARDRYEIDERIGPEGEILCALTMRETERVVDEVLKMQPDGVAICLLFAFLNPDHEQQIRRLLEEKNSGLPLSTSHEVQPVFREYERFSTTVLNTYLQPVMSRYIQSVERVVHALSPRSSIGINQSSGGLMSVEQAVRFPVRTALSGPAAGVVGAIEAAVRSKRHSIITLDVGGTSTDVALVREAAVPLTFFRNVAGFPIRLPCVDVNAVGTGGGSLIAIGPDGLMSVGPNSAGAVPGAACYGKGGTQPTVSDANLILGRLPEKIAGGDMTLDVALSRKAMLPVSQTLGVSIERASAGALRIVASNLLRAIRAVSVERGHDPRSAVLMPYGGAGGLHAIEVAEALELREVLVPPDPGILCARGLMVADRSEVFVATRRTALDADITALREIAEKLLDDAREWVSAQQGAGEIKTCLDMRFIGQNYELPVDLHEGFNWSGDDLAALREMFWREHERAYGHADRSMPVEIMNVRITARIPSPPLGALTQNDAPSEIIEWPERDIWFEASGPVSAKIIERTSLTPGVPVYGPAVIEQADSTLLVWPHWRATQNENGNLMLEKVA